MHYSAEKEKNKGFFMEEGEKFLVVDVGATKTLVMIGMIEGGEPKSIKSDVFINREFSSLEEVLEPILKNGTLITKAAIGVAGAIVDERCLPTNLGWIIDKRHLESALNLKHVVLINDLELAGYGVLFLKEEDLLTLQAGKRKKGGVSAVLAVGTGLGECTVLKDRVLASEGGHADFAPTTKLEFQFLEFMKQRHPHVSLERALSGKGIQDVYDFFSKQSNLCPSEIFEAETKNANQTKTFFLRVLGKEAGNLALRTLCFGGLFLAGGVLQKNPLLLQEDPFIDGFREKGRFSSMLRDVPIYLVKGNKGLFLGGHFLLSKIKKDFF